MTSLAKKWMAKANNSNISDNSSSNQPEMKISQLAPTVLNMTPILHKPVQNVEPQWHYDFCQACGDFNNWRGCCPLPIDDCLLSRVIDAENNTDQLKGITIGQGVKTDDVLHLWCESGELIDNLFKKPVWLFCIAEHIANNKNNRCENDPEINRN